MSFDVNSQYIPTVFQQFIYKSRYSRWLPEEGRREDWPETVDRYMTFVASQIEKHNGYKIPPELYKELKENILNLEIMPSMRLLMSAGRSAERENINCYNCAFIPVDSPRSFDEAMYIALNACGVGFSVESKFVSKLPPVAEQFYESSSVIVVEDTKAGWAGAYRELIAMLYAGQIPHWDTSKVRPAGSLLEVSGGRASGPEPLEELFRFAVTLFQNAAGRQLLPIECHDLMCKTGEVVVVGGVRRTALISYSDLSDSAMSLAKSGAWWEAHPERRLANNTAIYDDKPTMETFMQEWSNIYNSKSGERGIFNIQAAKLKFDEIGREFNPSVRSNPSLAAGTKVWTSNGIFNIEELENKKFFVKNIDGELSRAKCWLSGENKKLLRVNLEGGHHYDATPEHKWPVFLNGKWVKKRTDELIPGDKLKNLKSKTIFENGTKGTYEDGFVLGWNLSDGWLTQRKSGLQIGFIVEDNDKIHGIDKIITNYLSNIGSSAEIITKKEINVNNNKLREIFENFGVQHKSMGFAKAFWDSETSEEFRRGYIDALISADGHVEKINNSIIFNTSHKQMALDMASALGFYGIKTNISYAERTTNFGGPFGRYVVRIFNQFNVGNFHNIFTLTNKDKEKRIEDAILRNSNFKYGHKDKSDFVLVKSVEDSIIADVWDIEVDDDSHAFQIDHCVTGNCNEIFLNPFQFCNLSNVVVKETDNFESFKHKVELATILGTFQSSFTNFKYLRKIWKTTTEKERLLGVGLCGALGNSLLFDDNSSEFLSLLRKIARETNNKYADKIGIARAAAITCDKPDGNTSQFVNSSSGIHPWHNDLYARSVRIDKNDPVGQLLKEYDIPCEDDVMDRDHTWVFTFPIKAPGHALLRKNVSAIEHLNIWLNFRRNWCDHNPSVTISVKDHEWLEVGSWVYEHFDELGGVSFLPYSEHTYQQAPYQDINENEYQELLKRIPKEIRWDDLMFYEKSDQTVGSQTLACSADGGCENIDLVSV